jgi:general secretion pathway protein G
VGRRLHAIRQDDSGFTLTELLIVIVILGVLSGIVVFAVGKFSDRGDVAACKAAMKTTEVAVETYRANTGNLPDNIDPVLVPDYLRTNPNAGVTKYTISYTKAGDPVKKIPPGGVTGTLADGSDCSA